MHAWLIRPNTAGTKAAKRLAAASLFVLLFCGSAAGSHAAAPDFGSPPAGEFPIIFNDHTVYSTPDILKQRRVLAALVKNGRIYVPLRSMFEQMGATGSASADGRNVTAVKPGASVSVTVGTPEVVINGETRPLDVPPIVYHGIVLVPVRVISEAMGAYVQWVPDRRIVVVRYIPAVVAPQPATPARASAAADGPPHGRAAPDADTHAGADAAVLSRFRRSRVFGGQELQRVHGRSMVRPRVSDRRSVRAQRFTVRSESRLPPIRVRHERQSHRRAQQPLHALLAHRRRHRVHARLSGATEQLGCALGISSRGSTDLRRRGLYPHRQQLRVSAAERRRRRRREAPRPAVGPEFLRLRVLLPDRERQLYDRERREHKQRQDVP